MKLNVKLKKAVALLAAVAILSGAAYGAVLGTPVDGYDVYLGSGMELSKGVYWTGSDYRTENYIEYSPSADVYPVVVSGSKVCNRGSFSSMAALLENQGKHVIGGVNGDYYVVATGAPLGIVVENGLLRSSDAGHWAVGFQSDGRAIIGKPALELKLGLGGREFSINGFNKTRTAGSAVLLTSDFSSDTKSSGQGIDVVCSLSGSPSVNGRLTLTVESVSENTGSVTIPEGKAILSIDGAATQVLRESALALTEGQTVILDISCAPGWESVSWAIGSLYKLVTDGKVEGGLANDVNPRSAVGVKADGTLVFYTVDGRQSGHSVGVTMTALAQRMVELGCVEAVIMDGGGSTSLNAIYIGDSSMSQINKPSDGYQRSVTNYIMLVTDKKPTGVAERLALYPLSTNILSGASADFTVKAADAGGYPASPGNDVLLSVSDNLGTIGSDGVFKASGEGKGTVIAEAPGLVSAAVEINVVKSPDILRVYRQGTSSQVSSLSVETGSVTDLMAQAMDSYVYLISEDSCYTWRVEGNIGEINGQGVFTAGEADASGSIVVSAGDSSVSIPVTVRNPQRYDDVPRDEWYYEAVEYAAETGLMNGIGNRRFDPEGEVTRAMVAATLYRSAGSPAVSGDSGFSDVDPNAWYGPAVAWAADRGIVQGYGGRFDPEGNISREQLAAMLHRYMGSPASNGSLSAFTDAGSVSDWAEAAVKWGVEKGVLNGMGDGTLNPGGTALRAQLAAVLMRLGLK